MKLNLSEKEKHHLIKMSIINKLEELFNDKYLKMLDETESDSIANGEFDELWDDYLDENNCKVQKVAWTSLYALADYCSKNNLIKITDPQESGAARYILVPIKFAEKALTLRFLP